MEYSEFITHVQSLAQSESREEAEVATRSTLEIIKQIVPSNEREELAAQIPQELWEYIRGGETEPIQSFHLQEFIERISQRENLSPTITIIHVRVLLSFQQPTLQKFKNSRHCVFETCSYLLFQLKL